MTTRAAVLDALDQVRDPELDEGLTRLGFVADLRLAPGEVDVELRLPTYFCAPNFSFLMVADARQALLALPGVERATVRLADHFTGEEITGAVARGESFAEAFPDEALGGLDELRDLFARKAFVSRQRLLATALERRGATPADLAALRVADLPPIAETRDYLERRRALGLDVGARSPAMVDANGQAVEAEAMPRYLRVARLVRVSVEGNGWHCRGLLETRYGLAADEEINETQEGVPA